MRRHFSLVLLISVSIIFVITLTSCFDFGIKKYLPPQIKLKTPLNNATGLETTLLLTWEATPGVLQTASSRLEIGILGYAIFLA